MDQVERLGLAFAFEFHRPRGSRWNLSPTAFAKSSETWIRYKATGSVVYDNQRGDANTADAATALGGGQIVIQKK